MAFGSLFDDMAVARRGDDGKIIQVIHPVPISYAPRDKFLSRLDAQESDDPDLDRKYHEVYPRMAFEMVDMSYAPNRALPRQHRHVERREGGLARIGTPTPYDITFSLSIAGRNTNDCHQIVEQILPNFKPQNVVTMNGRPAEGHLDVPIVLSSVSWEDEYDGALSESVRRVVFDMVFVAQYQFHGQAATPSDEEVVALIKKQSALKPEILKVRERHHLNAYGYYDEENVAHEFVTEGSR